MKRALVISDTHIPRTADDMPRVVYDVMDKSDIIIHAGDFVEKPFYDKLAGLKDINAVRGNMDSSELTRLLSDKLIIKIGKFKIGLIHGHGAAKDIIKTVRSEFDGVDAIVFGHSHIPLNLELDGILFFNPGSPTDKVFSKVNSYGILEITEDSIKGRIIEI